MSVIINALYSAWNQVIYAISNIRILDILDILVMAYIIYKLIGFARDTRAGQLVKGIGIILVMYFIASWFSLPTLRWLLSLVVNSSLVVLVVIFHPEIRRMLEKVGSSKLRTGLFNEAENSKSVCIENVCKAAGTMQDSKIGALIVFERNTLLGDIISTGTVVDAVPAISVINNIFFPKSPLHDGAVIIRNDRIYAAGCILPLTQNNNISSSLGTRHRAAIGISEQSDAVILVVSEETGTISIVQDGKITRNYSAATATVELKHLLTDTQSKEKDSGLLGRVKKVISSVGKEKKDEVKSNEK